MQCNAIGSNMNNQKKLHQFQWYSRCNVLNGHVNSHCIYSGLKLSWALKVVLQVSQLKK